MMASVAPPIGCRGSPRPRPAGPAWSGERWERVKRSSEASRPSSTSTASAVIAATTPAMTPILRVGRPYAAPRVLPSNAGMVRTTSLMSPHNVQLVTYR
jgi:hypothetical protein